MPYEARKLHTASHPYQRLHRRLFVIVAMSILCYSMYIILHNFFAKRSKRDVKSYQYSGVGKGEAEASIDPSDIILGGQNYNFAPPQ